MNRTTTLKSHYYYDEAIFAKEVECIFKEEWLWVARSEQLSKQGDFITTDVAQFPIVLVRGKDNILRAFHNICRHRASKVELRKSGNCKQLVCPYHGFCYINGGLKTGKHKPLKKVKISLKKFCIKKIGEFIFFSINPCLEIEEQFDKKIIKKIKNISENISYAYDYNQKIYDCNYDIAIENALEAVHVNAVHPNTLATLDLSKGTDIKIGSSSEWISEIKNKKIIRAFNSIAKIYGINSHIYYNNLFLFPFSMISSSGGISYSIQNFFPKTFFKTNFISRLYPDKKYFKNESLAKNFFDSTSKLNRKVFDEDAEICSQISKNEMKKVSEFLVEGEERILWFRKAREKYLKELSIFG